MQLEAAGRHYIDLHRSARGFGFVAEEDDYAFSAVRQAGEAVPLGGRGLAPASQREEAFADFGFGAELLVPSDFFVEPVAVAVAEFAQIAQQERRGANRGGKGFL